MEEHNIEYYLDAFEKLKRAPMRGFRAPHKPLLLLSIMQLIDDGVITSPTIELSPELINCFHQLWEKMVDDGDRHTSVMVAEGLDLELSRPFPFKCSIENPFYYMSFEPFWSLEKSENYIERKQYTLKALQACFKYASVDEELFFYMANEPYKTEIRICLEGMVERS